MRWVLALGMAWGLLASPLHAGLPEEKTPPQQPQVEDMKKHIMQLLSQLHDANPTNVENAKRELRSLGLQDADIKVGWKLRHPDANVRRQLAQELKQTASPQHTDLVLELTNDPNRQVRLASLDVVRAMPDNPRLQERVRQLAGSDGDPIVRGNARLLAAEMKAGVVNKPSGVRPNAAPTPTATKAAQNPFSSPEPFPAAQPFPSQNTGVNPPFPDVEVTNSNLPRPRPVKRLEPADFVAPQETLTLPRNASQTALAPVKAYWNQPATAEGNPVAATGPRGPVGSYWEKDPSDDGTILQTSGFLDPDRDVPKIPAGPFDEVNPEVLDRPFRDPLYQDPALMFDPVYQETGHFLVTEFDPPNGFSGPSSVLPREQQTSSHFVPVEDRWRIGYPEWDRYGRGHPWEDDYPFVKGHWWDPYNQNVLKGDYPIIGQHTFMNLTIQNRFIQNFQKNPIGTTPFESTKDPLQEEFFGRPGNFNRQNYLSVQLDLFHAVTAAFKPLDWQVRIQPIFNHNNVEFGELAVVNPDVRKGTHRTRHDFALEQYFVEAKLADLGPDYDFLSTRLGSQFFNSDFRGFIFNDINRAARLFGTRFGNRDQFNILWFDMLEKETNSLLNTFDDRHQNVAIANYYRQDFIFPGYTAQVSYHYNNDNPSFKFDENNFLVRPDPAGVFEPHRVEAHYLGFAGDGHIGRINVSNHFYWALGKDSKNPIANEKQDIDAKMFALELSIDRDWIRFRTSYLYASGDDDVFDDKARGFDAILENPNFAGGDFTYWQRQAVRLFGVNLTNQGSPFPDLTSSRIQGQANFVNPGLHLVNVGADFEVTPKLKLITNMNYLWFDSTEVLEVFTFQDRIDPEIGLDLSMGIEYRPFLTDNIQIIGGLAAFIPGKGFDDLYGTAIPELAFGGDDDIEAQQLYSNFIELILQY